MPTITPKDLALYAVELCTELSIDDFRCTLVDVGDGSYVKLEELGHAAAEIFALTKDAVIRQIARSAREVYPAADSATWKSAAARLIVNAVTDVRDDDRLSVIAETATPDGEEAAELSDQLLHSMPPEDAFEALLPIVARATRELLDGIELHLTSVAERRR